MVGALDTSDWLHDAMVREWAHRHEEYMVRGKYNLQNRFARAIRKGATLQSKGDERLKRVEDIFFHGFGITWSPTQARIFNVLVDSCLPIIYGSEWEFVKMRVMKQRGLDRMQQETLVNMARRNGKTFVVSGAAAALWLAIPGINIAVFSAAKRQAGMFMTETVKKIRMAWDLGTHVDGQGFQKLQENQESFIYEHPEGGKCILGCFPGSVRVSYTRFRLAGNVSTTLGGGPNPLLGTQWNSSAPTGIDCR